MRCTVEKRGGAFCDAPSMPDAPFPICPKHADELFRHMKAGVESQLLLARQALRDRVGKVGPLPDRPSVVYYARELDGSIKIGYTQNLDARMSALRLDRGAILATEPGAMTVERRRHKQFAHLRQGRMERFRPAPDLMAHIAALSEARHALSDS